METLIETKPEVVLPETELSEDDKARMLLADVAEFFSKDARRWITGDYNDGKSYCAVGAIWKFGENINQNERSDIEFRAERLLAEAISGIALHDDSIPECIITGFNDDQGTVEPVIQKLREAASLDKA